MLPIIFALLTGLTAYVPGYSDNWAEGLFERTTKDFGAVARGSVLKYSFRVANNTPGMVHVIGLRVSCGCTTARMEHSELAPGQSTVLSVEMHSDRFVGDRAVNVYVLFDQPEVKEIALQVKARSCEDVSVSPETLDFGLGPIGQTRKAEALVTLSGLEQCRIQKVATDSHHVHISVKEMPAEQGNQVYKVIATLDEELPAGNWYTEVWLYTNRAGMERIRIPVRADVEPALLASPALLKMEIPVSGQTVQHKVVVHGHAPFSIVAIKGVDDHWSVHEDKPGSSAQHFLTVTLENPNAEMPDRVFQVATDLPGARPVEFRAQVVTGK